MSLGVVIALAAAALVVAALVIGWLMAQMPRNRKAFKVASALFLGFGIYNPNQDRITESREDQDYGKRQKAAGDPPAPGEED
jgi:putative Ca2+/H+ antiporter (TMEM165/GDT1 family)